MFSSSTSSAAAPLPDAEPLWLVDVRESVAGQGPHLAWDGGGEVELAPLPEGFTRIGRSIVADIHLSGPTVSRRHALVHREGSLVRAVDDHSLNGLFVNGEQVDWRELEDGDRLEVGGFALHFVTV
jgi:FHA domain